MKMVKVGGGIFLGNLELIQEFPAEISRALIYLSNPRVIEDEYSLAFFCFCKQNEAHRDSHLCSNRGISLGYPGA